MAMVATSSSTGVVPVDHRYPQPRSECARTKGCGSFDNSTTNPVVFARRTDQFQSEAAATTSRQQHCTLLESGEGTYSRDGHGESDWRAVSSHPGTHCSREEIIHGTVAVGHPHRKQDSYFFAKFPSPPASPQEEFHVEPGGGGGSGGREDGGQNLIVTMVSCDCRSPPHHLRQQQQRLADDTSAAPSRAAHATMRCEGSSGYEAPTAVAGTTSWKGGRFSLTTGILQRDKSAAPSSHSPAATTRMMRFSGSRQSQRQQQSQHEQWQRPAQQRHLLGRGGSPACMKATGATFGESAPAQRSSDPGLLGFPRRSGGSDAGIARPHSFPRISEATRCLYPSVSTEVVARSPSPGVPSTVYVRSGQRPTASSPLAGGSFAHARSLSEGHHLDSGWRCGPSSAYEVPLRMLPPSTGHRHILRGPHERANSEGTLVMSSRQRGGENGSKRAGEDGGGGGGTARYVVSSSAHAGGRSPSPLEHSSRAMVASATTCHGHSITCHHTATRRVDRSASYGSSRDSISSSATLSMITMASEHQQQHQRQQPQQGRVVAGPTPTNRSPGFGMAEAQYRASPERHRSAAIFDGDGGVKSQIKMTSVERSADQRNTDSEMINMPRPATGGIVITSAALLSEHDQEAGIVSGRSGGPAGLIGNAVSPSPFTRNQASSRATVKSSPPLQPPLLKPPPKNPVEWLQRLERSRNSSTAATATTPKDSASSCTSPVSCMSSGSSLAPSPASGVLVATDGTAITAAHVSSLSSSRTCPAPDCPGTDQCLPGATPDMVVYEVRFKRSTRIFLPGEFFGDGCDRHGGDDILSVGDRVKVGQTMDWGSRASDNA